MVKKKIKKKAAILPGKRPNGHFAAGNTYSAGMGGAREGAGRKPQLTQEVLAEIQSMMTDAGVHVGKRAFSVVVEQMELAQPSKEKILAARIVMDRVFGRSREMVEVKINSNTSLTEAIDANVMHEEIAAINHATRAKSS